MKKIASISLGPSRHDYEFKVDYLGEKFKINRIGTDGDFDMAQDMLQDWDEKVDAIGIGSVKHPYAIGPKRLTENRVQKIEHLSMHLKTPVTTGAKLKNVAFDWAIRYLQFKMNKCFTNARVLFLSGMLNYTMAKVMNEYTDNLTFADPIFENGVPKFLNNLKELEIYANNIHEPLKWSPSKYFSESIIPVRNWNEYIIRKAMQKATVIVIPYFGFYQYLKNCTPEELGGKTIITSTVYEDRIKYLQKRGVNVIIDCTPKILERVVGVNVIEAMMLALLNKRVEEITEDDLLELISEQKLGPRVIYPSGAEKRISRFAFVIHPLSKEYLKKEKSIEFISRVTPPKFMDTIEKVLAYSPPFVYSKVTGIVSPTGDEAEGWLITVGGTPKQMLAHTPEFTYRRLLLAAKMAKRLGAQIMGLGAFTKVVGDAGVTVAKKADIPITTGNSYSASGALWAAADAVRRMGLIPHEKGQKIKAKSMVVGATGAIGSVCCRLLAMAFEEVYMVGRNTAKLLALKESILEETPTTKIHLSTRADRHLPDMDVIVTTTSGAGKKVLDITKVKPGCVITDVARPLDLPPEEVAKRPDVLVIESGEILMPGDVQMKSIGLPNNVAFACLAETIVLALEGKFEVFTIGRDIEWQKVKEIYKMGLKHGMRLAAISGVNGIFTDEDIARVKELALEARAKSKPVGKQAKN